jgi:CDP-glycerol glycerophosphotransferase (TagB/SpsB family)
MPKEYTVVFRPHPQTPKRILKKYNTILNKKPNVFYASDENNITLNDILYASSVFICDVSSVTLEVILTDKPLLFTYQSNSQIGNEFTSIRKLYNYCKKITDHNVTNISAVIDDEIQKGIDPSIWHLTKNNNFFHHTGTSTDTIARTILEIARS